MKTLIALLGLAVFAGDSFAGCSGPLNRAGGFLARHRARVNARVSARAPVAFVAPAAIPMFVAPPVTFPQPMPPATPKPAGFVPPAAAFVGNTTAPVTRTIVYRQAPVRTVIVNGVSGGCPNGKCPLQR